MRLGTSPDAAAWACRIERDLLRITTVTRLEVGYSARYGSDLGAGLSQPPISAMPVAYLTPVIEDRAVEVLSLTRFGRQPVRQNGASSAAIRQVWRWQLMRS